jgi:hypothetical protein
MSEYQAPMAHEKPKHGKLFTWTRRALVATGILAILSQTSQGQQVMKEGQEFLDAYKAPSAENSAANHITTVADGGVMQIDLNDKTPYTFIIYTGTNDANLPITEVRVVHTNQIEDIDGQQVPAGATAINVANPGWNNQGEVPFIADVTIDNQAFHGVLEVNPLKAGVMTKHGDIRVANGDIAGTPLTETGTGLRINEITFELSAPATTTSSQ